MAFSAVFSAPVTIPEFALPDCSTADVTSPPTPSSYIDFQDSTTSFDTDVSFQGVPDFADVFPQMLTSPLDQTALRRALLSAVPSLHTLDLNTLESIIGSFSIRSFSSGDVICPSGGTGVFVLAQGSVLNLSVDNPLIVPSDFDLTAGQGFGGLEPSRSAFVAESDVIVYFISAEAVAELVLADIFAAPLSDRLSLLDDLDLADFEVVRMLGRGSFGAVALVKHLPSDRFFVLKQVDHQASPNYCPQKEGLMADLITQTKPVPFDSETFPEFMTSNARPFICRHIRTLRHGRTTFFLQEFLPGGSVTTLLNRIGLPSSHVARARVLSESDARFYLACLVLAVSHIHSTRHMHRDIKTANFMLDHLGYATLIDNSLLVKTNHHGVARGSAGTLSTMAPEVAKSLQFGYTFTADVWSLGAVLMKVITGSYPYDHSEDRKQLLAALRGPKPVSIPTYNLSPDLTDLLTRLLEKDPDRRIGAEKGLQEIRDHPWFHGFDWGALERRELTPPFVPVVSSPQDCQNLGPLDATLEMIKLPTSRRGAISDSD
ncbi:putative cGMP-dependent serine/threonin protein kinase [Klebsormidium nitens]|uniref:Putative cGMP-dependent serine/threonin protein kinase n=1 Tax=Klebsormidium nitens TaxID=105231 RepID=A0A1Y1HIU2_KLENI|nr:putative cGMP-dependent serine/threonin protein kinase [Klebsormidium nitens]|eukprot:GAQ78430.1 putative cGMP-dependent serine/threonin protein kinase [Klebsormidium nitens]